MTVIQKRLGFNPGDRLVVVHVDDIGMSHPANVGAIRVLEDTPNCGSVMVPCPAFDEIAEIARARPELDLGVHITLNSEFPDHRWGPVLDDVPSLTRPDGTLWQRCRETIRHADPGEVAREMRAQVQRALDAGIDVTHIDAHMGTALDKDYVSAYAQLGIEFRLPVHLPRRFVHDLALEHGLRLDDEAYAEHVSSMEAKGFPIYDMVEASTPWYNPFVAEEHNRNRLARLGDGLSILLNHAAEGSDELRAFAPDWLQRHEEHRLYSDGTMSRAIEEMGFHRVGTRQLRDALRRVLV